MLQFRNKLQAFKLVTPAIGNVVELSDCKAHMNIDFSVDDDYITSLIIAATDIIESEMSRQLLPAQWLVSLYEFPRDRLIELPFGNLISIDLFQYTDRNYAVQTVDPTIYVIDSNMEPANIMLKPYYFWPFTLAASSSIRVTFTCGYADEGSVPQVIKQAIMIQVNQWYSNRTTSSDAKQWEIDRGIKALIQRYKIMGMGM